MTDTDNKITEDENIKTRIDQLKIIRDELDKEFLQLLGESELTNLEMLSVFTDSVKNKLSNHYSHIFPKKCNTCKQIYNNIEEYRIKTAALASQSTIFDDIGLQEYRNCICGSTLIVWTKTERRDTSTYGKARRDLFNECLKKLLQISNNKDPQLIEQELRKVFAAYSA